MQDNRDLGWETKATVWGGGRWARAEESGGGDGRGRRKTSGDHQWWWGEREEKSAIEREWDYWKWGEKRIDNHHWSALEASDLENSAISFAVQLQPPKFLPLGIGKEQGKSTGALSVARGYYKSNEAAMQSTNPTKPRCELPKSEAFEEEKSYFKVTSHHSQQGKLIKEKEQNPYYHRSWQYPTTNPCINY